MRFSASEKYELIQLVQGSDLSVRDTLKRLDIHRSTFYNWLHRFEEDGFKGLEDKVSTPKRVWNRIDDNHRQAMLDMALDKPELSPRELAVTYTDMQGYYVSESSMYRLLKQHHLISSPAYILMQASDEFAHKTTRVNEMWQTDFTYFKIIGWGWYYLSTVLDDYSRYIVAWKLCSGMGANDVSDTLEQALEFAGLHQDEIAIKPRLLSDNGPCYLSNDLSQYLESVGMKHTRGRPYHPQTQGKIERWHRTMKNQVKLENYYFPHELGHRLEAFVNHYNHKRYHESLDNLTPADVFYGRGDAILQQRQRSKQNTIAKRRKMHYDKMINVTH